MNVTKFDKSVVNTMHAEMEASLQAIARKYNVGIHMAGGSFSPVEATLKFKLKIMDQQAAEEGERAIFERYCRAFGLRPEHFGVFITVKGERRQFVGLEPSRPKFCIKLKDADGTIRLWSRSVLPRIQNAALVTS